MMRKFLWLLCSIVSLSAAAQDTGHINQGLIAQEPQYTERIINFASDIRIDSSGLVTVTEHIKIYANNDKFVHGLLRFIPMYRSDIYGSHKKVDFEIVAVEKNGQPEEYKAEKDGDNRKIYIGSGSTTLEPGTYTYDITYRSRGHVGFFDTYDELYWNVTGNEWDFEIEKASATIHFPVGAQLGNTSCYTGPAGSKNQACSHVVNNDQSVTFTANGSLQPSEGFTVAAAFTPFIIKRPGMAERLLNEYSSITAGIALIGFFALLYYLLWRKYGRDPEMPVVVPTFHVPNNWSPAVLRYFYKKYYDDKATAAALINMGVKRAIKITSPEAERKAYQFDKLNADTGNLAAEEQALFEQLLGKRDSIKTTETNAETFVKARRKFEASIKSQLKISDYYKKNLGLAIWTSVLSFIGLVAYLIIVGDPHYIAFFFMLPFIAIGISLLVGSFKKFKKAAIGAGILMLIFGGLATVMPLIVAIVVLKSASFVSIVVMGVMVALYMVFILSITAYTQAGIQIQSQVEGFKLYLNTAEEHRLNLLNPPELTPQVFEKFLPYAIALDLENAWGQKFEEILRESDYEPDWYNGDKIPYRTFATSMPSTFYSSVSVSPTPKDTSSGSSSGSSGSSSWSSGSSGGGSSGGGGGGGGGGGW
ncbi:DUF2207 domain-containing protein [Mucilaginibacter galii]|uniref:DUF2207 domain-containing protein n=1 Tax=Mucilaginibacter galii TaxID=2005073 RepID=A0A917JA76_9SPHI|nr:DUF2207 domain-containing protein [Mucilaginibacter galii]GGI50822.1 hypothetical protein GCM10011425_20340 [Mucilaginibacter galii]